MEPHAALVRHKIPRVRCNEKKKRKKRKSQLTIEQLRVVLTCQTSAKIHKHALKKASPRETDARARYFRIGYSSLRGAFSGKTKAPVFLAVRPRARDMERPALFELSIKSSRRSGYTRAPAFFPRLPLVFCTRGLMGCLICVLLSVFEMSECGALFKILWVLDKFVSYT